MKKIIFSVLMSVLLISPMEKVTAQMNSMAFYQKPTQSWSEYLKERKDNIIRTALIATAVISVGVCLYMWGPSLSVFFKGLFLGAMKNIETMVSQIRTETYGPDITPLHQTSNHFYYQNSGESFISGDCGIFAARRLVNHARILGYNLPDLSTTSNQQLRDITADYMNANLRGNFDYIRTPLEWLTQCAVSSLMRALGVPEHLIRFTGIGEDDENAYEKATVFKY